VDAQRQPSGCKFEVLLLTLLVLVLSGLLLGWGWQNKFITYRQDFGETSVAYRQSKNLQTTFGQYGMLHVEMDSEGGRQVYIHNVNIGTFYFFGLRMLGMESRSALTISVLPIYLFGLICGYIFVRLATGSRALALTFFALMALDFANVGAFAFNALRSWHYLGLFGALIGAHFLVRPPANNGRFLGPAFTAVGAIIAFGCGYDFFVIVGGIAVAYLFFVGKASRLLKPLIWIGACFFLPFLLRQLEVAYWMGLKTWFMDFSMTLAIKIPLASRLIALPPIEEIDRIYKAAGLLRPPAQPAQTIGDIVQVAATLGQYCLLPAYGLLGCLALGASAIAGVVVKATARTTDRSTLVRLSAALLVGALAGLLAFAPFSLHVYLKHNFPLIAALVHFAEAIVIVVAAQSAWSAWQAKRRWHGVGATILACLFALNFVVVQSLNARHSTELDFRWIRILAALAKEDNRGNSAVTLAVALPTGVVREATQPVGSVRMSPDQAPWMLAASRGLLVESPLIEAAAVLRENATLVYAPGDSWSNFDAREPDLSHQDWILGLFRSLRRERSGKLSLQTYAPLTAGLPETVHPDDLIHLRFFAASDPETRGSAPVPELRVQTDTGRIVTFRNIVDDAPSNIPTGAVSLLYNARSGAFDLFLRLPDSLVSAGDLLTLRGALRWPDRLVMTESVEIQLSRDAPRRTTTPILPEPTTDRLIAAFPGLGVRAYSSRGAGFVILDVAASSPQEIQTR